MVVEELLLKETILSVQSLKKYFPIQRTFIENLVKKETQYVRAVDDVTFNIDRGEVFGLAGESGSGKTTIGRLILRLAEPTAGKILFNGVDLESLQGEEFRRFRRKMQVIFQDPYASLNPRMKIGDAIGHPLEIHNIAKNREEKDRVLAMMERVGLSPATALYDKYPHQLSGGQRQRVAIARALILQPEFVVADEPIAMVDVSMRAMILELMMELKKDLGLTYLFITHDLATAKYVCNRIAIMYLGKIVESGPLQEVFSNPQHPYTEALLSAVPIPDPKADRKKLIPKGEIPNPINPPSGCRFHPRCPYAMSICSKDEPQLQETEKGHYVACYRLA